MGASAVQRPPCQKKRRPTQPTTARAEGIRDAAHTDCKAVMTPRPAVHFAQVALVGAVVVAKISLYSLKRLARASRLARSWW